MNLDVVWEDEHLLVVDKPAGVVVHPGTGHQSGTLVHGLLAHDAAGGDEDRPGIVHRLDRDTSGLLVVARSDEAHARLQELIRRRAVERRYLALVKGTPRSRTGRIEAPIGRDRVDKTRHSLDTATPRDAVTHFEVLELLGPRALLELTLETGRTHQIRVHLEAIELLISGDPVYGSAGDLGLERQFLHAARLALRPPVHRRARRRRVAAARGSRRGARARPRRTPDRSYTARVVIPSVPATQDGWGCCAHSEYVSGSARAPPACTAINRERGQSLGSRIHA